MAVRKILVLALILVFATATAALAFGLNDIKKAAKGMTAKEIELKLSDASGDLKSYEGGDFDPVKGAKKYTYKEYDHAQWDSISKTAATSCMVLDFSDAVLKSDKATQGDVMAAVKALEPLATGCAKLVSDVTGFIGSVTNDPTKALMLKDAKGVMDNVKAAGAKVPDVLKGLKEKAAGFVADAKKE